MPSFTQRILEGFSSLLDKVGADGEGLSGLDAAALDAELEARAALRQASRAKGPRDNPRAKLAGTGEELALRRAKLAREREARIHAARDKQAADSKRAQDEAFRRMAEEARRQASAGPRPSSGPRPSAGPRPSGGGGRARAGFPGFGGNRDAISKAYRTLDLQDGADFAQVKSAYRKLMRRYHPDLHGQSAKKQKAATELSLQVTQAYKLLETHLQKK